MAEMFQQMASRVTVCAYCLVCLPPTGRDGADCIATRYGLEGPGIESRWGARFSAPVQTGPGTQQPSFKLGTGSSPRGGVK